MSEVDNLKDVFEYYPDSGDIIWKKSQKNNQIKAGSQAGNTGNGLHLMIGFQGKRYLSHRLAWFLFYGEWPNGNIDHINGNGLDNRICNMRICTQSQNLANSRKRHGTSNFKGVTWNSKNRKWISQIRRNGVNMYLGSFDDEMVAHLVYMQAARKLFGEFARFE